ncbi:MAG: GerMN domain-containing protein [Acidobacteriota bacterium]|nr:GerMN domain-containing protein [Acidobacteriota bacterium]MDW3228229.1 GerMN domain-containing protein [Acidobacteriota bacterium]MDY0231491.1 GerMN domain-containing protein [Candidatus Saccharicenans sp.]
MKNKNKSKKKKLTILYTLLAILVVVVLVFFFGSRKEKIKHPSGSMISRAGDEQAQKIPMKKVTLFFLSESDNLLHPEEREIPESTINQEARVVVEELIKGSNSGRLNTLPAKTQVRQVFVTSDGTAYVDLSRDIIEASYYGSTGEMAAVYSIINSLTYNFSLIKKVFLLVEGNERETLGGHIDLSRPFVADYSLVAR